MPPTSWARLRVRPMRPALLALYAVCPVLPRAQPITLPMLIMRP